MSDELKAIVNLHTDYRAELESARSQLAAMREALISREWETVCSDGKTVIEQCPICDRHPDDGHDADCWIGKVLADSYAAVERHNREQQAKALRDAADNYLSPMSDGEGGRIRYWLRKRAGALERGEEAGRDG